MAMTMYIRLSRVQAANDILLTNVISPILFTNGPFPWPNRLMLHLREHVEIDQMYAKSIILKNLVVQQLSKESLVQIYQHKDI